MISNGAIFIGYLGPTVSGKSHNYAMLKDEFLDVKSVFSETNLMLDLGYLLFEKYFSKYLNDFTNLQFDNLELEFLIAHNLFIFDKKFYNFKVSFLKMRYNLYLLKELFKNRSAIKQLNNNGKY